MRAIDETPHIVASVLDRLFDADPGVTRESATATLWTIEELQDAVLRDLTVLLNTKRSDADVPKGYRQAARSLMSFGIPDISSATLLDTAAQERLRRAIEEAIRFFEPRLTRVAVTLIPSDVPVPSLHFRVDALLNVDPVTEPVAFDTVLHADTRSYEVLRAAP